MKSLYYITKLSLKETIRDRILWGYGAFALLLLLGLFAVAKVPWGETHYMEAQLGYSAIALVTQVFVAVVAALQYGRDAERRVHYMILGRDIKRSDYLLGKFLGLWLTASMLSGLLVVLLFGLVASEAVYRGPMWSLLGAIPAISLQAAAVLAVAVLLYELTTSTTLAMLLALLVVAIGRSVASVQILLDSLGELPRLIGHAGAYVFPNLELLVFNQAIIFEQAPGMAKIGMATAYGLTYTAAALSLAIFFFARKEL